MEPVTTTSSLLLLVKLVLETAKEYLKTRPSFEQKMKEELTDLEIRYETAKNANKYDDDLVADLHDELVRFSKNFHKEFRA